MPVSRIIWNMKARERIWFSLVLLFLCSCHTKRVVQEDNVFAEHTNIVKQVVRDSIFLHDSVFIREKADTVFFTKYRTLFKEKLLLDTVVVCDTVYIERVVTKEISKPSGSWRWRLLLLLPLLYPLMRWLWKKVKMQLENGEGR